MNETVKAILIDTEKKECRDVEIPKHNALQAIYSLIGNDCETISASIEILGNTAYYDDEGLFHEPQGAIIKNDWYSPIVGNILLVGTDSESENKDVSFNNQPLSAKYFQDKVFASDSIYRWVDLEELTPYVEQFN